VQGRVRWKEVCSFPVEIEGATWGKEYKIFGYTMMLVVRASGEMVWGKGVDGRVWNGKRRCWRWVKEERVEDVKADAASCEEGAGESVLTIEASNTVIKSGTVIVTEKMANEGEKAGSERKKRTLVEITAADVKKRKLCDCKTPKEEIRHNEETVKVVEGISILIAREEKNYRVVYALEMLRKAHSILSKQEGLGVEALVRASELATVALFLIRKGGSDLAD
jgi:hypothetical protein